MKYNNSNSFEVCVDSIDSLLEAETGGANRIELCDNLAAGGTTPSYGMIKQSLSLSKLPVRVMIRPRGGDFLYSNYEIDMMKEDIQMAKSLGSSGVVFGVLTEAGTIDKIKNRILIEIADPLPCTFHRAFDMCEDPQKSLEDIINLGFDFLLTSGMESNVVEGTSLISELVIQSGSRIKVMAGTGIHAQNVSELIRNTGVQHIHASASHSIASQMKFRNPRLFMGSATYDEFNRKVTSSKQVADILSQAKQAWEAGKSKLNW